jgi:hypothetical protein
VEMRCFWIFWIAVAIHGGDAPLGAFVVTHGL